MFPLLITPNFSKTACLSLLKAAEAAYETEDEARAIAEKFGATFFQFIESKQTDTQCFIAMKGRDILIGFRGTKNLRDWITDARFHRIKWFELNVHTGFMVALDSVFEELYAVLLKLFVGKADVRFWLCGHSLGGALANLCAYRLSLKIGYAQIAGVYTFGQPRVMSAASAVIYNATLKKKTFRIVNAEDPVPRLPGVLAGYRHCGTEIFLDSFGKTYIDLAWWQKIPSDINGFKKQFNVALPFTGTALRLLSNHFINNYTERLNR